MTTPSPAVDPPPLTFSDRESSVPCGSCVPSRCPAPRIWDSEPTGASLWTDKSWVHTPDSSDDAISDILAGASSKAGVRGGAICSNRMESPRLPTADRGSSHAHL